MTKTGLAPTLFLAFLAAAPLLAAPPLIRGLAARHWVDYYASRDGMPRPRRASVRTLVLKTSIAMNNLAPLPQASDVALRALEIGQRVESQDRDKDAALAIYRGVREACARVRSRWLSGPGFAVIEARAAALEQAALKETPVR
jgi:hypothetical protein